jgi:hypothetical protein
VAAEREVGNGITVIQDMAYAKAVSSESAKRKRQNNCIAIMEKGAFIMPLISVPRLSGEALDYAVAKACGLRVEKSFEGSGIVVFPDKSNPDWVWLRHYNPSANWAIGGPILEKHSHTIIKRDGIWEVEMFDRTKFCLSYKDEELLVAAMRCYVAVKLGYQVEIPEELL